MKLPAEGTFEVAVLCMEDPTPPTPVPTHARQDCAWDYVSCGDVVLGSTVGARNLQGNASGDALLVLGLFEPTSVYLTTCTEHTDFKTQITVWRKFPSFSSLGGGDFGDQKRKFAPQQGLLAELPPTRWHSEFDVNRGCATLNFDVTPLDLLAWENSGGLWIAIDGYVGAAGGRSTAPYRKRDIASDDDGDTNWERREEGNFELVVQCSPGPTLQPTAADTPFPTHHECYFKSLGSCEDYTDPVVMTGSLDHFFGDFKGGPGVEAQYVIQVTNVPERIVASTCNANTNFNMTMWIFDGCPSNGGKNITRSDPLVHCGVSLGFMSSIKSLPRSLTE